MTTHHEPPDRVLVTGTGRCGSTTFLAACRKITNWSSYQESIFRRPWDRKLDIPERTIEVSPPLAFWVPRLLADYPRLLVVHLWRRRDDCVRSLARLRNVHRRRVMAHWALQWTGVAVADDHVLAAAGMFYDGVNDWIDLAAQAFAPVDRPDYQGRARFIRFDCDNMRDNFPRFWAMIQAEGDLDGAMTTLTQRFNTGKERGEE